MYSRLKRYRSPRSNTLDLGDVSSEVGVPCQLKHPSKLESLSFYGTHLTPECFAMMCDHVEKLKRLQIKRVPGLTDEAGKHRHCLKKLKLLKLSGAVPLTDSSFIGGVVFPGVEHLDMLLENVSWRMLGECLLIDEASISIRNDHPHVQVLIVSQCLRKSTLLSVKISWSFDCNASISPSMPSSLQSLFPHFFPLPSC